MAGVFEIPMSLIERDAAGLDLIMHARSRWGVPCHRPIVMGQLLFADWLMTDPDLLPEACEAMGINVGVVLAGESHPSPTHQLQLETLTGGAIRLADWTRFYSGAACEPAPSAAPLHHPADGPPPRAGEELGVPLVHGRLGEREPGSRLFRCIRGEGENRYLLTGHGITLALDRGSAAAIVECLSDALGDALGTEVADWKRR